MKALIFDFHVLFNYSLMYSFYFLTSRSERCFQSLSTHNVVGKYWSVLSTYSYNVFSLPKTKQMIRSLKYTWIFLWHYASVTFKCRVWTPPKAAATPDLQKKHRGHDPSAAAGFSPAYWTSIRTVCFIKRVKKKTHHPQYACIMTRINLEFNAEQK